MARKHIKALGRLVLAAGIAGGALVGGGLTVKPVQAQTSRLGSAPAATVSADKGWTPKQIPNYRDGMRDLITGLSDYGKGRAPRFLILTREGLGLTVKSERESQIEVLSQTSDPDHPVAGMIPTGSPFRRYVRSIDGVVMNDQYCVPTVDSSASLGFIKMLQSNGLKVLSVDHCADGKAAATAFSTAWRQGVLAQADQAPQGLARVPSGVPGGENSENISTLAEARNILFLDNNAGYTSKRDMLAALRNSNFDVVVMDVFFRDRDPLTPDDLRSLHLKKVGSRRLLLARLELSHASDTRYYWKKDWKVGSPAWLAAPILANPGSYDVNYWDPDWKALVGKAFAGIMDLGFDGVVLEGVDAYKPLEARTPLK